MGLGKKELDALLKALEAGNYNAAPAPLVQGTKYVIEPLPEIEFELFKSKAEFSKPEAKKPVCECGAAKTGIQAYKPGHSKWCPVFA